MASVIVNNIEVKNNPAQFNDPMKFEITFEAVHDIDNGNLSSDHHT